MNGKYWPQCDACWSLRKEKGSKYTTNYVQRWVMNIQMAIECREKSELIATDKQAIMDLLKTQCKYQTIDGTELMVEAKSQLKYTTPMDWIHSTLPKTSISSL